MISEVRGGRYAESGPLVTGTIATTGIPLIVPVVSAHQDRDRRTGSMTGTGTGTGNRYRSRYSWTATGTGTESYSCTSTGI